MTGHAPHALSQIRAEHVDNFGGTHQGRIRPINEDRFLCRPNEGIWLVADGMGGHSHGDIASSAIVQAVDDGIQPGVHAATVHRFSAAIFDAHDRIQAISEANGNLIIGSTVAGLVLSEGRFSVIWTGDSRVYLMRDARILQLTRDHTEAQMLLRQGAITESQAKDWPRKNVIVHAIGVNETPHIERTEGESLPGDTFVLCTDGLTSHVTDKEIQILVTSNTAQRACVDLIRVALERGGKDNITVVVVRVGPHSA